jgi:sugar phosphate isomerase/epimerase
MKSIKGPGIFLAQFVGNDVPFNTLESLCRWSADLGYKGIQIPTWESSLIDLDLAAESKTYCDDLKGKVKQYGLEITELSTHLQGQLVAVHPAYDKMFDPFAPRNVHGKPKERTEWAVSQVLKAGKASQLLNIKNHATFSGALVWPFVYPWPQRPDGLVETGFNELAKRWLPILNSFDEFGVNICYEIHPGEDLHDGYTFEHFLDLIDGHKRACLLYDPSHFLLQQLDYIQFIDFYHERIKSFHVKDAEFNPTGKSGVYGGYMSWINRAGRFRSLGDGHIDFTTIFSKLSQYDYDGWAVMEWECCIKSSEQGAKEGAPFINAHIIDVAQKAFDDFAESKQNEQDLKDILGIK